MRKMGPQQRRLAGLVLSIALLWAGVIWSVIEKYRQYRFPLPLASTIFYVAVASVLTVGAIRVYLAAERHRRGE
jgi:hypothetical protein